MEHTGFSQNKAKMLQKVNKQHFDGKEQKIYDFVAKDALSSGSFSVAQSFSLQSSNSAIAIEILEKWPEVGNPEERPWFVTRYILLKLASEKYFDAKKILEHFSSGKIFENASALHKILECIFKSIESKATEVFQALQVKFEPYAKRDPELGDLLDRVAQIYFGIIKQRQPNIMDMMSRMMGM